MVLWRKKAPKPKEEEVPAPVAPIVAAEPEEERLPPPAAFRASQEIANRNFCDDDDDEDDHAAGSFATSESLVREALCGRIDPPPAGPLTARSEALSEATTARAPSRESSPRDAVRTVSFDAPPPRHRPQSGRPPRPGTAEAVSRALRRARGGYVDDADDDDGASDDEEADPVAAPPDEERVRPPDPAQRMRLVEMEIPSFAERFPFAPDSPVQERRARPSTAGPGAAGRAPAFAVARRPATAGPRRRRSQDALACLRAPLDLSLCDFLDDLVNLCDAAEAAEKRRTA